MIRAVRVGVGCLVTHFVASIRLSTLPPSRACALWSVTPPVVPSRRAPPLPSPLRGSAPCGANGVRRDAEGEERVAEGDDTRRGRPQTTEAHHSQPSSPHFTCGSLGFISLRTRRVTEGSPIGTEAVKERRCNRGSRVPAPGIILTTDQP